MTDAHQPVVIGVGQVTERGDEPASEPVELAREALVRAADDAGIGARGLTTLRSVDVVNLVSWSYGDVARELAARVGATPVHAAHSDWGGNQPTKLLDRAAERIASGEVGLAAIAGAEAFRSLERALKTGSVPASWPMPPPDAPRPPDPRSVVSAIAWDHGLRMPIDVYPLFENAVRDAAGLSFADSQDWSARMWSRMSKVASANDGAWHPTPMEPAEISTVSERNRMVGFPYPKLMNALMSVNQGAAVLLADTETARSLGVPESQWVYPCGGAGANDADDVLARVGYARSPAMERVLDDVFPAAGIDADAVDLVELYSCFPCVPKMALRYLGWDPDRPMSVTGGLTFFGGAGNNYMTHALVAMVRSLRRGDGSTGLLYGQGGFVTKHHALVLGREPRPGGYPCGGAAGDAKRQGEVDALESPAIEPLPRGAATVETFTAHYGADGEPERGVVIGRFASGERFVANTPDGDAGQLAPLVADDATVIGCPGTVAAGEQGRNVFRFG